MSAIVGSHDAEFAVEVRSQWRTVVRRFLRHKLAMISLVTLTIIFLASIFG